MSATIRRVHPGLVVAATSTGRMLRAMLVEPERAPTSEVQTHAEPRGALSAHIRVVLASARGPRLLALIAALISLPAMGLGLQGDDRLLFWQLEHGEAPWGLFRASEELIRQGRASGAVAWWVSTRLSLQFFRPLASLTHYVDFYLWPGQPWLMSLVNVALYALIVLTAGALYRRFLPSGWVAGLAGLLFAVNEANAISVGWISGRNTLMALLGALAALWFHVRARAEERASFARWSALTLGLALLSGEAGLWGLGLLLAYALTHEQGVWHTRLASIGRQLVVGVVWAGAYVALGCGVRGASFYRELSAPATVLREGLLDLPLVITSLFGPSVVGLSVAVPTAVARLASLPCAAFCAWLMWPVARSRQTRFFGLATLLCALPAMLSVPQDRILVGASFGAFGLIANVLEQTAQRAGGASRLRRFGLYAIHLLFALLAFPQTLKTMSRFEHGNQALVAALTPDHETILVNSPVELLSNYAIATVDARARGTNHPGTVLHQLYAGQSELLLERIDAHTLDVRAKRGWGHAAIERIFCTPGDMPPVGRELRAHHMTARVLTSNADGMPERVRFSFPTPLESEERAWLLWRGDRPVAFRPPKVGERMQVAPLSLLAALPES